MNSHALPLLVVEDDPSLGEATVTPKIGGCPSVAVDGGVRPEGPAEHAFSIVVSDAHGAHGRHRAAQAIRGRLPTCR